MSLRTVLSALTFALISWTALPAQAQVVYYRRPAPRRVVVVRPVPRPVYYAPAPVVVAPRPVYYAPAPVVVVRPRPVAYRPRPVMVVGTRRY